MKKIFKKLDRDWSFDEFDKSKLEKFVMYFLKWNYCDAKICASKAFDNIIKNNNQSLPLSKVCMLRLNFWKFAIEISEKMMLNYLLKWQKYDDIKIFVMSVIADIKVYNLLWSEYWRCISKWLIFVEKINQIEFTVLLKQWDFEQAVTFANIMLEIAKYVNINWNEAHIAVNSWAENISFAESILQNRWFISNSSIIV